MDTQNLLPFGTPEEVRAETEYIIRTMNVDGGYILGPSQDFEGDVLWKISLLCMKHEKNLSNKQ